MIAEKQRRKPGPKPGTVRGNGHHMRGAPLSVRLDAHTSYVPICGCWLWTGALNNMGYGMLMVNGKRMLAHRASYEVNVGPIPDGLFALHQCDTPSCVNPNHITLGTQTDNMQQCLKRGRFGYTGNPGVKHKNAKLSEQDVIAIRNSEAGCVALGRIWQVSPSTISHIKVGRTWRNI